jgi:hypothetical protein
MENILSLFPVFVILAMCLVVIFTELIKKLDKKDRLKGHRVYVPFVLSFAAAWVLRIAGTFEARQVWFWWAAIFGFSVFFYEAILKKCTEHSVRMNNFDLTAFVYGLVAVLAGCFAWRVFCQNSNTAEIITDAERKREEKRNEIQNLNSLDITASAPDAASLRAETGGIKDRAKKRLRDRIGEALSRLAGRGDSRGGGERDR